MNVPEAARGTYVLCPNPAGGARQSTDARRSNGASFRGAYRLILRPRSIPSHKSPMPSPRPTMAKSGKRYIHQ
jgi:hypothetical protein